MKKLFNYKYSGAMLSLVAVMGLTACGDDGNSAAGARANAIANISRVLGRTMDAASNADAITQVSNATQGASEVDRTGNVSQGTTAISNQQTKVDSALGGSQASPVGKAALRIMQMGVAPRSISRTMDETVTEMLDVLLQNPTTNSDGSVVYHPDAARLCGDPTSAANCRAELSHVTIVLVPSGSDAGTLTVRYDSYAPLVLGYAPNTLYVEFDVGGVAGIITARADSANNESFVGEGRFRVTVRVTGEQSVEIVTGVTQAIDVVTTNSTDSQHLAIAKAENAMRVAIDGVAKKVLMQYAIGEVSSTNTPIVTNTSAGSVTANATSVHLDKLAAKIEFSATDGTNSVHVSGVDMGENGFESRTNGVVDSQIKVTANDFSVVENATQWTMTFTDAFQLDMYSVYQSTTVKAQADTVMTKSSPNSPIHLDSGLFSYASNIHSTPPRSATLQVSPGQCFAPATGGEAVLVPFKIVQCS